MKNIVFLLLFILVFSCKPEEKAEKPTWLLGKWIRTNNKPSYTTYETWHSNFSGTGITLKDRDTTFFEKMKLLVKNDTLILEVSGVNEQPTPFKFTQQTDTSFICVNPKNEFPKNIKYWISNQKLHAKIWNNESFSVDFIFEKQ